MMFEKDPKVIHALVTYRQERIRSDIRRSRAPRDPSWLRVVIGLALIHIGERIQGCARATSADTLPSTSARHMRPVRHA